MLDWAPGVMTGNNQRSYWIVPDTLKSLRTQKSALNDASVSVAPPGIHCWLTFWCLKLAWIEFRGLNR